ncbi:poly-gamma-glutamate hydrolase family protein [Streptomyces sp. NBRC 110611]|uniref:poly-gamma-glutamate hydrolase family protein n=1 Tax=Streptomyces sp. NBRC 110611 TaxID=1621259 RepID=UPI00215CD43C|nr:poly-gamma-glutamate hydrolase family protein [Streptomyces sp. NBRC 110611]
MLTSTWGAGEAHASGIGDKYHSHTDLYTKLPNGEGTEYTRRYRRHEMADDDMALSSPYIRTMIMAMHGGGIEPGTSELCLGIAGYDPRDLTARPAGGPVYDYWMFEGLRKPSQSNPGVPSNRELHVTAKNCDDHVALSMAASSLNVLSLHGCTAEQAGAPAKRPEAVVIGGRNTAFQRYLTEELRAAGFQTVDGATKPDLNGDHVRNPCNRTMLGKGGQLELTTELRRSMFKTFSQTGRRTSYNDAFRKFTDACRAAIIRLEAGPDQVIR